MKEVIMPKFGFTQEESQILEWMVKEGDTVEQGDTLALVSTDKVSMEVEAPEAGIVAGLQYKQGDIVPVTKTIAYILQPGESLPASASANTESGQNLTPDNTSETQAKQNAVTADKTTSILLTPVAARMVKDLGIDPALISGSGPGGKITRDDVQNFVARPSQAEGKVRATPAARRLARENNLSLETVKGSGPEGRIQAADVQALTRQESAATARGLHSVVQSLGKEIRSIPFEGMRKAIAQNMTLSAQTIPAIQLEVDVRMESALALHERAKLSAKDKKVSLTAIIIKALAWALARNPLLNAQLGEKEIFLLPDINIGIAVSIETGLIVPVIHHADQKGILELAEELNDISMRARQNKLRNTDLTGGTFTLSNLGMFGIDRFTAIINPPQVAILAVGAVKQQFYANQMGQPVLHYMMNARLSADHRVVDGVEAARFLSDFRKGIENPEEMLL